LLALLMIDRRGAAGLCLRRCKSGGAEAGGPFWWLFAHAASVAVWLHGWLALMEALFQVRNALGDIC
jgi:hypothetical protein